MWEPLAAVGVGLMIGAVHHALRRNESTLLYGLFTAGMVLVALSLAGLLMEAEQAISAGALGYLAVTLLMTWWLPRRERARSTSPGAASQPT